MTIRRRIIITMLGLVVWFSIAALILFPMTRNTVLTFRSASEQTVDSIITLEQFQIATMKMTVLAFSTMVNEHDIDEQLSQLDTYYDEALLALNTHSEIEHSDDGTQSAEELQMEIDEETLLTNSLNNIYNSSKDLITSKLTAQNQIATRNQINAELVNLNNTFINETEAIIQAERLDLNIARRQVRDDLRFLTILFLGLYLLTITGAGGVAWTLGTGIIRPIDRLRQTAISLSQNNLDTPIEVDQYQGELKALAGSFSDMVSRIRQDIQQRERIEKELRQQDTFLETIINANPSRIFVRNVDGRYLLANIAHAQSYNVDVDDIIGKTDADLHNKPEEALRYMKQDLQILLSGEATFQTEEEVFDFGVQENRWMNIIKVPLLGTEGTFDRVLCVMTDVTDLVRAGEALGKARDEAEEASRLKSEFLATMSHELRTPLNAVIGFSGIMLEGMGGEIDDNARSMIQAIYDSSTNLLAIINDILDIAKIEAGRLEIINSPFSPQQLADGLYQQMRVLAEEKNIGYVINRDEAMPDMLMGDEGRIKQIAINLISNAIKFTDEGQVTVNMTWDENGFGLDVIDTGTGISPHAQTYIFDQFRQIDGTSRRKHGGTGLGLAIVRKLVETMQGQVTLQSKLKEGSTFSVRLPLKAKTES